jgi:hypothetical protein
MNRASAAGQDVDPAQAQRAIEQARRQLQQALQQMTSQRQAAAAQAFSDLADRSNSLYTQQRQVAEQLKGAIRDAGDDGQRFRGGIDGQTAFDLGERKQALAQELEALERDIQQVSRQFRGQTPGASERLDKSLTEVQQSQAGARLTAGGDAIRRGYAREVAATDAVTTAALRDLQQGTREALDLANREAVEGQQGAADPNQQLVAELRALRREMNDLTQGAGQAGQDQQGRGPGGNQPGQEPGAGQQQAANQQQPGGLQANQQDAEGNAQGESRGSQPGGNQPGGQAGGQQAGNQQQPGGAQQGGAQQGGQGGGGFGGPFAGGPRGGYSGGPGGYYDPTRDRIWGPYGPGYQWDPQQIAQARDRLQTAGDDLIALGGRLRAQGLTDEQMRAVRALGERLRAGLSGNPNPDLIARELQNLGNLVDQLELQLTNDGQSGTGPVIRTAAPVKVERGYEDAVAEYYRRLSESKL